MLELILTVIFLASFTGILFITIKSIPVLSGLPVISGAKEPLVLRIKNQIKNFPGKDNVDYEFYLQKLLSKIRILTLRTEQKTGHWLEMLRKKSNEKKINIKRRKDNYWEELKKAKEGK